MSRRDLWSRLIPLGVLLWLLVGLMGHASAAPGAAATTFLLVTYALLAAAATKWVMAICRKERPA